MHIGVGKYVVYLFLKMVHRGENLKSHISVCGSFNVAVVSSLCSVEC
jgi:hypothetical protein